MLSAEIPFQPPKSTAAAPARDATHNAPTNVIPPSAEFYSQLLKTLKMMNQAASQQQKIIVELRENEESIDLAKLQTSMLKLFYVGGEVDWDEGMAQSNESFFTAKHTFSIIQFGTNNEKHTDPSLPPVLWPWPSHVITQFIVDRTLTLNFEQSAQL